MLHVASVCTPCCMLLGVVAQSLKPVQLLNQQLPKFLLFCVRRSVAQQCWIRLHSSSNVVMATHAHYTWFTTSLNRPFYYSVYCVFSNFKNLSPVLTDATLLANNSQHCWMLHVAFVCTPCCMLLDVVAQSLKPVKLFSQQLPTFLLFCDRRSVAQQCWIPLHGSSNIVKATHAHYAWITKTLIFNL